MQTLLISLCETANFINFTMRIGKFANFAVRNRESFANRVPRELTLVENNLCPSEALIELN